MLTRILKLARDLFLIVVALALIDFGSSFVMPCPGNYDRAQNDATGTYHNDCAYHGGVVAAGFDTLSRLQPEALTAMSTVAIAWFTFTLWLTSRGQLRELTRSINTVQSTEKRQLRAYVGIERISFHLPHIDHLGWKVPEPLPAGYTFDDTVLVTVRNFGVTPAYELRVIVNWQPVMPFGAIAPPDFLFTNYAGVVPASRSQVLDNAKTFTATINVPEVIGFQSAIAKVTSMYIYGHIAYTDVYGRRWHRQFCYIWEPWREEGLRFVPHTERNDETYEGERQPKMPA